MLVAGVPTGHLPLGWVRDSLDPHPHLGAAAFLDLTGEN